MVDMNQSMYSYLKEKHSAYKINSKMISFYGRKIKNKVFFEEVDKIASFLQNKGIKKGDNVIICLGNIPNAIISFYAVNKIGAIANLLHPLIKNNQLEKIISKTNPKAVIVFNEFFKEYDCLKNYNCPIIVCSACDYLFALYKPFYGLYSLNKTIGIEYKENVYKYSKIKFEKLTDVEIAGSDTAIYMHSSGTTGESKIACISNQAMNNMQVNLFTTVFKEESLNDKWGMLMALPIFHTFGLGVCMHTTLCVGAQAILMPKFNVPYALLLLKFQPVNIISGIPGMFKKLADSPLFKGKMLLKIKECFCGGEKLSDEVKQKFEEKLAKEGSTTKIAEGYGLTETGVVLLNTQDNSVQGSIGAALKNVEVKIVDDNLAPLKAYEKGNILISSKTLMNGYYLDEQLTNKALVTLDNKKWVNSGDIGYIDESKHVFFVDREKRLIKISGNNVFPREIENYVNEIEEIDCSCAVKGEKNNKAIIKLYVQMKKDYIFDKEVEKKIVDKISNNMLKYALPSQIICIKNFPKTMIGKIDYKQLEKID